MINRGSIDGEEIVLLALVFIRAFAPNMHAALVTEIPMDVGLFRVVIGHLVLGGWTEQLESGRTLGVQTETGGPEFRAPGAVAAVH